jgi:hypothetical protein
VLFLYVQFGKEKNRKVGDLDFSTKLSPEKSVLNQFKIIMVLLGLIFLIIALVIYSL